MIVENHEHKENNCILHIKMLLCCDFFTHNWMLILALFTPGW